MHRVTTLVHQLPLPTTLEERQPPIATSTGKQPALPPRQPTISVEPQLPIETVMATPSVHRPPQPITLAIPQQPIVTDMATPREQIVQAPIISATQTPVTQIPMATPEAHLPLQQITSATLQQLIVTDMVAQKVHPRLLQITLEIAVQNSEATTPTAPSGPGNEYKSSYNKPRMHLSHLAFEAHSFLFTNQPPKQAELTQNG